MLSMQVMYQLLWRALLEPRAASVEEEWEAIQKYSMGVAEVRQKQGMGAAEVQGPPA